MALYLLSDPVLTWGSALYVAYLDYSRLLFPRYANLYDLLERVTGSFIKERERRDVSDATRMALGVALSLTLFGKYALIGLAVSIPGDALASVVGKTLGGPRIVNGKSLSGFMALLLWSGAVGLVLGDPIDLLLIGAAVGVVEMFSTRWENLTLGVWGSFLSAVLVGNLV